MARVSSKRFITLAVLFGTLLYAEYFISEYYKRHSWLGYGFVDNYMKTFTKEELVKSVEQIDPPFLKTYILFELLDCIFCCVYGIFLCDVITILVYPATSVGSLFRWIDIFPFILALVNFLENFTMIIGLNYYPYGVSPACVDIAVSLSVAKHYLATITGTSILFSVLVFVIWTIISTIKGKPKPKPNPKPKAE